MKRQGFLQVSTLIGGLLVAPQAWATSILGDNIQGVLQHANLAGFNNWNANANPSPTLAVVGAGTEFAIPAGNGNFGFAVASADFGADTITVTIGNPSAFGDSYVGFFNMHFSDLNYSGPITGVSLINSTLPGSPGIAFGASTIDLTLPTGGFIPGGTLYSASFQVASATVPEPSTYAMMLTGLAALGFMAYRRKPQAAQVS